jgi:hypothetical protein
MPNARSTRYLLAVLALALASSRAAAQIEAGDKAISVSGSISFSSTAGSSSTSGFAFGSLQYFMTRQLAVRANISEFISGGASSLSLTTLGAGLEYDLQREQQTTVPYFAFDVATTTGGGTGGSSMLLEPSAGIRFFVSRNTALNVAGLYQTSTSSSGSGTFVMQFGLSVFFGGDKRK